MCRVAFSTKTAVYRIRWQQSSRLVPGTVVAVSTKNDQFRSVCKIATVGQRPFEGGLDQHPPLVDIIWAQPHDAVFDPTEELVMVESRLGYFESARHVLLGLQQAATFA